MSTTPAKPRSGKAAAPPDPESPSSIPTQAGQSATSPSPSSPSAAAFKPRPKIPRTPVPQLEVRLCSPLNALAPPLNLALSPLDAGLAARSPPVLAGPSKGVVSPRPWWSPRPGDNGKRLDSAQRFAAMAIGADNGEAEVSERHAAPRLADADVPMAVGETSNDDQEEVDNLVTSSDDEDIKTPSLVGSISTNEDVSDPEDCEIGSDDDHQQQPPRAHNSPNKTYTGSSPIHVASAVSSAPAPSSPPRSPYKRSPQTTPRRKTASAAHSGLKIVATSRTEAKLKRRARLLRTVGKTVAVICTAVLVSVALHTHSGSLGRLTTISDSCYAAVERWSCSEVMLSTTCANAIASPAPTSPECTSALVRAHPWAACDRIAAGEKAVVEALAKLW